MSEIFGVEVVVSRIGHDKQAGAAAVLWSAHADFHAAIERSQKIDQTLDRKSTKLSARQIGNLGLINTQDGGGFTLAQAALSDDAVNLDRQLSLMLPLFWIRKIQVGEHIAAARLNVR